MVKMKRIQGYDRHIFALYVVMRYLEEKSPLMEKIMPPDYELSTSQVRCCIVTLSEANVCYRHHCNRLRVLIC